MTQVSLKLADFTHDFNVMINDFRRLEKYTDSLQAEVAAVRSNLAERDTMIQMLIDDHRAVVEENERLRQALRFIHEMATEDLRTAESGSLWSIEAEARTVLGLAAADDERLALLPVYEETG